MKRSKKKRYHYLTVLRALSLMGVSVYHLFGHILPGGFLAVIMFLVLSGFLMEKSRPRDFEAKDLINKFKSKYLKLIEPLGIIMAISLIISLVFAREIFDDSIKSSLPTVLGFENIRQIIRGGSYFDRQGNFNIFTHLWYISIYISFILIYFLEAFLRSKFKKFKNLVILIMTLVSIGLSFYLSFNKAPIIRIYYGPDTRIYAFLLGVLGFRFYKRYLKDITLEKKSYKIISLVLGALFIIPMAFIRGESYWTYRSFFLAYTLICLGLVVVLYSYEENIRLKAKDIGLVGSILNYLGQRSLYIYIWQYIVQVFFAYFIRDLVEIKVLYYFLELVVLLVLAEISFIVFKKKRFTLKGLALILAILLGLNIISLAIGNKKQAEMAELEKSFKESQEATKKSNEALKDKKESQEEGQAEEPGEDISEKPIEEESQDENEGKENASEDETEDENSDEASKIFEEKPYDDLSFTEDELSYLNDLSVTAVGDSVLINIDKYLRAFMPNLYLDGLVGRDMVEGPQVLGSIKENVGLSDIVVIALGSNGSARESDMSALMDIAEGREVYFVNTSHLQSYMDSVNENIREFCEKNEKAHLVDWRAFAKDRPEILAVDRTHPNVEGSDDYAKLIMRAIINNKAK